MLPSLHFNVFIQKFDLDGYLCTTCTNTYKNMSIGSYSPEIYTYTKLFRIDTVWGHLNFSCRLLIWDAYWYKVLSNNSTTLVTLVTLPMSLEGK